MKHDKMFSGKYLFIIVYISLFLLFIWFNIHSISSYNKQIVLINNEIQNIINKYENTMNNMGTEIKSKNYDLMTDFYKLRLEWTNEKIQLETAKNYVKGEIFRIYVYAGVIVLLGSLGLWAFLKSFVINSVYDYISNLTMENKNLIKKIIETNKEEEKVKAEKSIMILAKNISNIKDMKMFLSNMGFDNLSSSFIDYPDTSKNYDLIFINNQDGNIEEDPEKLKEKTGYLLDKYGEDKVYFYYNNTGVKFIQNGIQKNFSNSKFTLYRNLIDTLMVLDNA